MTIATLEDYPASLSCYLLVGSENDQNITWTWHFKNVTLKPTCLLTIESNNTQSTLSLNSTTIVNKGYYYCTATNMYGSFTRAISLRIKSIFILIIYICLWLIFLLNKNR